jgi:uncharacterized protein HemX
MEPNNNTNQPTEANPLAQPPVQPVVQPAPEEQPIVQQPASQPLTQPVESIPNPPTQPVMNESTSQASTGLSETPKKKSGKGLVLLLILLLLIVGMACYMFFVKNQITKEEKANSESTIIVTPEPTATPTLTPEEDLEIESPEADLQDLNTDSEGL